MIIASIEELEKMVKECREEGIIEVAIYERGICQLTWSPREYKVSANMIS